MARSRARARLNCSSQGQRRGRCRVNRRAERVRRDGCTDKTPECIKVRGPSGVVSCPHVTPRMLLHRPISRHVGTATPTVFLAPPAPAAVAQAAPALGPRWSGGCWTTPATARESATPPPSEAPRGSRPALVDSSPAPAASSPSRMTQTRSLLLVPSRSIWRSPAGSYGRWSRSIRQVLVMLRPWISAASSMAPHCPGSEPSVPLHWSVTLVPPASAQDNGL